MKQKFELTLTSDYAAQWGVQDALREIIQNGIDQESQIENNPLDITYDGKDILTVSNKNSILLKETLLLGYSTKQDDDSTIGKFGEGYKIALLVLTRLNKKVTIFNYGKKEIWTSRFVKSKRYNGQKVLTITVDTEPIWKTVPNNNLTFKIEGINNSEYQELISRALLLQTAYKRNLIDDEKGQILLDEKFKGRIYVNGLYINTIDSLMYGYNIKPKYINIGRDRDLVSDYDIQQVTSSIWRKQTDNHRLYKMLKAQSPDVSYITSNDWRNSREFFRNMEEISQELLQDIHGTNENLIPVKTQKEADLVKAQYTDAKPLMVNSTIYNILNETDKIEEIKNKHSLADLSPKEEYEVWKKKHIDSYIEEDDLEELDLIFNRLL